MSASVGTSTVSTGAITPPVIPPLRAVREARGMSLGRVAAAAEMDVSHLSRVERGLASPSVDSLARLARVLGLPELAKLLAPYARGSDSPRAAA